VLRTRVLNQRNEVATYCELERRTPIQRNTVAMTFHKRLIAAALPRVGMERSRGHLQLVRFDDVAQQIRLRLVSYEVRKLFSAVVVNPENFVVLSVLD
jgi:hypothetical protein